MAPRKSKLPPSAPAKTQTIILPNAGWRPRPYQVPIWRYFEQGGKRGLAVWHRRAGKDAVCLHMTACRSQERVGSYWHMLPEYGQARRAVWDAVNPHTGKRIIDEAFPREMRDTTREDAMFIRFLNGSTWQLVGSDNYNSLVGSPPAGLIYSEYALADPRAWDYFRPILAENGGWAFFISTPRGRNHLLRLLELARSDPANWFAQVLTVDDTEVFSKPQLQAELAELIAACGDEAEGKRLFEQEYYCSFSAAIRGAYYAGALARLEGSGALGAVPYDPRYPVQTWWDLGIGDATAIWFVQTIGLELRVIDYYEASGHGLDHYANLLRGKGYNYAVHLLPHDGDARELGTGRTRRETLQSLQVGPVKVQPMQSVDDGINAVRTILPSCRFDVTRCERGLEALRQYRADYDEKGLTIKARPVHDWCLASGTQVLTPKGWRDVQDIAVHDQVLTPAGPRTILRSGIVRFTSEWAIVRGIRCTPEHRFFTSRGLVEAGDLLPQERLWTRDDWGLSILAFLCATFRLGLKAAITSATPEEPAAPGGAPCSFTGWFMRLCMEQFRRAMRSTIVTRILSTITPTTWRLFQSSRTEASTNQNQDTHVFAGFAAERLAVTSNLGRGAAKSVSERTTPKQSVNEDPAYNLTVETDECYFVRGEDGKAYLVSNSSHGADAFRTGAVQVKSTTTAFQYDRPRIEPTGLDEWPRNPSLGNGNRATSARGLDD